MIGTVPNKFLELRRPKFIRILEQEFPDIDVAEAIERYLDWIAKHDANPSRKKPMTYFRRWLKEDQRELRFPRKINSSITDRRNL